MINHISIAVEDPARTAEFLGKLWDAMVLPFPPGEGAFIVIANDGRGSAVEVLPVDMVREPCDGLPPEENCNIGTPTERNEAQLLRTEENRKYEPDHLNIRTPHPSDQCPEPAP